MVDVGLLSLRGLWRKRQIGESSRKALADGSAGLVMAESVVLVHDRIQARVYSIVLLRCTTAPRQGSIPPVPGTLLGYGYQLKPNMYMKTSYFTLII